MSNTFIGFSYGDRFLSKAIRFVTRADVSHAFIVHEAYGGLYVLQAEWDGFQVINFETFKKNNHVKALFTVEDRLQRLGFDSGESQKRVNIAAEWLGDSYDYWSAAAFILPSLLKFTSPRALICSEAVARAFPELFPGIDPEKASPGQLKKILESTE